MTSKFSYIKGRSKGDREQQQDDLIVLESEDAERILMVVADGMGGHSGGQEASKSVIASAKEVWRESKEGLELTPENILEKILLKAYEMMKVYEEQKKLSPRSTCVMLFIIGNVAYSCHIGDSRLYHFRNNKLLTRTKDHSVVQMLVSMGQVNEEEMGTHEDQGRLLKWVGGSKPPEATFAATEIRKGDQFLLCSDGLWEYVTKEQMQRSLRMGKKLEDIRNLFIKIARKGANGEGDNISLALLRVESKGAGIISWTILILATALLLGSMIVLYDYFFQSEGKCETTTKPIEIGIYNEHNSLEHQLNRRDKIGNE